MKTYKELKQHITEVWDGSFAPDGGGAVQNVDSPLDQNNPEFIQNVRMYLEKFALGKFFNPEDGITRLRADLNAVGLNFGEGGKCCEGTYPLRGHDIGKGSQNRDGTFIEFDTDTLAANSQPYSIVVEAVPSGDGRHHIRASIIDPGDEITESSYAYLAGAAALRAAQRAAPSHEKLKSLCVDIIKAINVSGKYKFKTNASMDISHTKKNSYKDLSTADATSLDGELYTLTIAYRQLRDKNGNYSHNLSLELFDEWEQEVIVHLSASERSLDTCAKKIIAEIKSKVRPKKIHEIHDSIVDPVSETE